jgi:hypothetical protein
VQTAAGWQPYSVKIGDTWYSYERLQPIGTLIGLAADVAGVWDHLTEEESDKIPKMLSIAFANAVTNQTFLQGITKLVNAMSDPKRFAPKFFQGLAGSIVPAAVAQAANSMDPVAREVDSMLESIQSRIPGMREDLLPKRDIFGEPSRTRIGWVACCRSRRRPRATTRSAPRPSAWASAWPTRRRRRTSAAAPGSWAT